MNNKFEQIHNIRKFVDSIPPEVQVKQKLIVSKTEFSDEILPFELYQNTRQNVEKISNQINKSFCYEVYDGASVLMRRLIEMLLILAFKEINEEANIHDSSSNYLQLNDIINKAIQNRKLDLTRNAKIYLAIFKEHGDLSAHNPFYNCTKKDLLNIQHKFRVLVEELFYKSGIKK